MSAAAPAIKAKSGPLIEKRENGFLALDFKIEFYELPRLTSGKTELCILLYILSETKSAAWIEERSGRKTKLRARKKGEDTPRFCRWITVAELAEFCNAKPRAVEDALARMQGAGIIEKDPKGSGYRCCTDEWAKLPDYTPEPAKLTVVPEPETEEETEEEKIAADAVPVFKVPLQLLPNRAGRARELPKPAVKLQLRSNIPAHIDASVGGGLLLIRIHGIVQGEKGTNTTVQRGDLPEPNRANKRSPPHAGACLSANHKNGKSLDNNGFDKFMAAGIRCELRASDVDWEKARTVWSRMPTNDRLAAVKSLNDHFEANDCEFLGKPQNFLGNNQWQIAPRKRKGAGKSLEDRVNALIDGFER